jgi:hypothetical protein
MMSLPSDPPRSPPPLPSDGQEGRRSRCQREKKSTRGKVVVASVEWQAHPQQPRIVVPVRTTKREEVAGAKGFVGSLRPSIEKPSSSHTELSKLI